MPNSLRGWRALGNKQGSIRCAANASVFLSSVRTWSSTPTERLCNRYHETQRSNTETELQGNCPRPCSCDRLSRSLGSMFDPLSVSCLPSTSLWCSLSLVCRTKSVLSGEVHPARGGACAVCLLPSVLSGSLAQESDM